MGSVFRKTFTRWVDAQGNRVRSGTPGARKVQEKSANLYGKYKDAEGRWQVVPLCTDKTAAKQLVADLERQVARGQAGLVDPHAEHRKASIQSQVDAYANHLQNKDVSSKHHAETIRRLKAVLAGAGVKTLADLRLDVVERYLARQGEEGASARTRNTYRTSAKAFTKWCLRTRRLGEDPLASLDSVSGEVRRQRRAFTVDELRKLLQVARERPVREALMIRRGKRKGQLDANVGDEAKAELERLGWERALMYKVLVMTGLRRGELEALEVRHLSLDPKHPRLTLPGAFTKNGDEASLPLLPELAGDLKRWIEATGRKGADKLFRVPKELVKILRRDLELAGIPYKDDQGRTADVHSFRHTTATILSKAKVSPRIAQMILRHSDIKLTMQTYTDVRLLDEAEALAALPSLDLNAAPTHPEGKVNWGIA